MNTAQSLPCAESCVIQWSHMGEMEVRVHTLILALDRVDQLPSCHSHCTLCATWTWSWEDHRHSLIVVQTSKFIPFPASEPQFLGHAVRSPDATTSVQSQLPSRLLLPSLQRNPASIANSFSLIQNFLTVVGIFIKHSQKNTQFVPILSQINPMDKLTTY